MTSIKYRVFRFRPFIFLSTILFLVSSLDILLVWVRSNDLDYRFTSAQEPLTPDPQLVRHSPPITGSFGSSRRQLHHDKWSRYRFSERTFGTTWLLWTLTKVGKLVRCVSTLEFLSFGYILIRKVIPYGYLVCYLVPLCNFLGFWSTFVLLNYRTVHLYNWSTYMMLLGTDLQKIWLLYNVYYTLCKSKIN